MPEGFVRLLLLGMTNRQIAHQLTISEGTARIHVANLMGKLGFRRRAEVAAWAVRHGLGGDAAAAVVA